VDPVALDTVPELRRGEAAPQHDRRRAVHDRKGEIVEAAGVEEREHAEPPVGGRDRHALRLDASARENATVAQHHPLRIAGGARRVHESRRIIRPRRLYPGRVRGVPGEDFRQAFVRPIEIHGRGTVHQDLLHRRSEIRDLGRDGNVLRIHQQDLRAGVVDQVFDLVRLPPAADGATDGADLLRPEKHVENGG
jgi:hypothetical protein